MEETVPSWHRLLASRSQQVYQPWLMGEVLMTNEATRAAVAPRMSLLPARLLASQRHQDGTIQGWAPWEWAQAAGQDSRCPS